MYLPPCRFLLSFIFHFSLALLTYRPHFQVRYSTSGDDWSRIFYRRSPKVFQVRWIPEDLCTAPGIISLSPLLLADRCVWHDTRSKWPLSRNLDRSWWHHHTGWKPLLAAVHGSIDSRLITSFSSRLFFSRSNEKPGWGWWIL